MIIVNRWIYVFCMACTLHTAEIRPGTCVSTASTGTRGNQPVRSSVPTRVSEKPQTAAVAASESAPAIPAPVAQPARVESLASVHNVSPVSQSSSPPLLGSEAPRDVLVPMSHRPVLTCGVATSDTRGNQPVRSSVQTRVFEAPQTAAVAAGESAPAIPAFVAQLARVESPASVHNVSPVSQSSSSPLLGSEAPRDVLVSMSRRSVLTCSAATTPCSQCSAVISPIVQAPHSAPPVAQAQGEWLNDMRVRWGVALFILYWYRESMSRWLYKDFNDQPVSGSKVRLDIH